jgi:hypothetical protein
MARIYPDSADDRKGLLGFVLGEGAIGFDAKDCERG